MQPKIKVTTTYTGIVVEMLGWMVLGLLWWLTASSYAGLPDVIPVHFNAAGNVDDTGGKTAILILPSVVTVLFAGLTILMHYPHNFNYPVKITEENAYRQYANAIMLLSVLKLVILLVFTAIAWFMIRSATGKSAGLGMWFLPVFLAMVFIPMGIYLASAFRNKRN